MQVTENIGFLAATAILSGGLGAWILAKRDREPGGWAQVLALMGFGLIGAAWMAWEFSGPTEMDWSPLTIAPDFGLLFNRLSLSIACLVAFLNFIITRFARRYLQQDAAEKGFHVWTQATISSVLLMVLTNNFLLFWIAWFGTSLGLHRLLTLYPDRPVARRTAALKFMISRWGDFALLLTAVLMWTTYGSFHFPTVFAAAQAGEVSHGIALLIVMGALTKSAQAPFHGWLVDTIETPTPVSALMHAGIINAGGYLILRTMPLVNLSSLSLTLLCLFGFISLGLAGLSMLATPDLKRQLALSTTAQMGFMFVQIGFGFPGMALMHMIAHAFYKAHAFLGSGTRPLFRQQRVHWTWGSWNVTLACLGLALLPLLLQALPGFTFLSFQEAALLSLLILLASSSWMLFASLAQSRVERLLGAVAALAFLGFLTLTHALGQTLLPSSWQGVGTAPESILVLIILGTMALFLLQRSLPQWPEEWKRRFLTHARHGFYFPALGQFLMRKFGYV